MTSKRHASGWVLLAALFLLGLAGCPAAEPIVDDQVAAGQAKFNQSCATCHSAASLRGASRFVVNDMGTVTAAMTGVILTDEEVANIKAFLLTQ
jgi:mono/diheme cytochrome c family protein